VAVGRVRGVLAQLTQDGTVTARLDGSVLICTSAELDTGPFDCFADF